MKIVGEAITAGGGFKNRLRERIAHQDCPGITGPFGLKPMCNDVPRQRERFWRAFVATDCYQLRNNDSAQPRLSKDPRAIFPCLERPT